MIRPTDELEFDCVVMGGGPGGSSTAALVAQAGLRTLLVEREKMPRFHVGESLMPETYWVLERLGVLDDLRQHGFVQKVGVQFVAGSGKESQPFFFDQHDSRDCSRTFHVERAAFDDILFRNAGKLGATCWDETRVTNVELGTQHRAGDAWHTVELQRRPSDDDASGAATEPSTGDDQRAVGGQRQQVACRVVVDATGQHALLANRLGLLEENPRLKKAAIWGYCKGAWRTSDRDRNTTIILHTNDKLAWFWYIPLSDDMVSVGVVADHSYLLKRQQTPAEIFRDELEKCPGVLKRVENATLPADYHVAKEFSYTTKLHAGPGWVLVGDAFGFIDPIYSSGVYLALQSGAAAADAIVDGFKKNDLSAEQLGGWSSEFKRGAELIRKLVHAFYTDGFSFGAFMRDHPEHQRRLTDLLIGRVYEGDVEKIFDDLDPVLKESTA